MVQISLAGGSISDCLANDGPELVARIMLPNARETGEDRAGRIRQELKVLSVEYGTGPGGGVAVLESKRVFISSVEGARWEDLKGAVCTIEARHRLSSNRVYAKPIFRGSLIDTELVYSSGADAGNEEQQGSVQAVNENSVKYYFSDWDLLMNYPVRTALPLMIGDAMRALAGMDYLWPVDAFGERIVEVDESLFSIWKVHRARLVGQPLGMAIAELFADVPGVVLDFEYKRHNGVMMTLVARTIGFPKGELLTGQVGGVLQAHGAVPDTGHITGRINYSNVINNIIGYGDSGAEAVNTALVPAWDGSKGTACLNNPRLLGTPGYRAVGKLFGIPDATWMINAIGAPMDGSLTDMAARDDSAIIWRKYPNQSDAYLVRNPEARYVRFYRNARQASEVGKLAIESRAAPGWRTGGWAFVEFMSPQMCEYLTEEQQEDYAAGRKVMPTRGWFVLVLQAMKVTSVLTAGTGTVGSMPYTRQRIFRNQHLRSFKRTSMYSPGANEGRVNDTSITNYDALPILQQMIKAMVDRYSEPHETFVTTLWYLDTSSTLGKVFTRIADTAGREYRGGQSWYVTRKVLDGVTKTTQLYTSSRMDDARIPGSLVA